jgi:hypothetical protein
LDKNYSYEQAGFDSFLNRSIDNQGLANLDDTSGGNVAANRTLNFDQAQVGGSLGDKLTIGNITLDGVEGQIQVSDGNNVRVIIGKLE